MSLGALSDQAVFTVDVCSYQAFNPVTGAPLPSPGGGFCDSATVVAAYYRGLLYVDIGIPAGSIVDVNVGHFVNAFGDDATMGPEMVPALQGSAGYFASLGASNNTFAAFDFRSGTTLWSAAGPFGGITPPIVVNDTVYYLDGNGTLHAFDRLTGAEVWNANGGMPPRETTLIPITGMAAGEGVLVVPVGRKLYALAP